MKNRKKLLTIISLCLAAALCFSLFTFAGADSVITEDEINSIVSTTTDVSLVTSPFTETVNQVRDSVVGISNYQTV